LFLLLPLMGERTHQRTPFITYILIAINILVHTLIFIQGPTIERKTVEIAPGIEVEVEEEHWQVYEDYGFVSARDSLLSPNAFLCMFLHGSVFHLLGNMLFLFVFGRGVEDVLGYIRYGLLYFASGWFGVFLFNAIEPSLEIPVVGASGAISGLLGAYIILLPKYRITVLFIMWFFMAPLVRLHAISAWIMVGIWFLFQLLGAMALGWSGGGVAYAAHIGGFVAGIALALLIRRLLLPKESGLLYERRPTRIKSYRSLFDEDRPPTPPL